MKGSAGGGRLNLAIVSAMPAAVAAATSGQPSAGVDVVFGAVMEPTGAAAADTDHAASIAAVTAAAADAALRARRCRYSQLFDQNRDSC